MENQEDDNDSNNDDNSETEPANQKISEEETASSVAESEEHKTSAAIRGSNSSKGTWSSEEDALLLFLMNSGFTSWTDISRSMSGRNSKQCRERWTEYVDPTLDRGKFTKEEDEIILREQQRVGNRWTAIAEVLPTKRTATAVKVRYNSLLRKQRKDTYITHYAPSMISLGGAGAGPGGGIYHPEFMQFASHLESSQHQQQLQGYPPLPPHFLHRVPMLPGPRPSVASASAPSQYFPYHVLPHRSHLPRLPLSLQQQQQQQQQLQQHPHATTTIPVPMRYPPPMSIARGHPYMPFHPSQTRPPPSQLPPQYYYPPPPSSLHPPFLSPASPSTVATSSDYYEDYPQPQPQYDHLQLLSQPPWQMLVPENQDYFEHPQDMRESYDPQTYYASEAENEQLYYQNFPPGASTNAALPPYPQPLLWYPSPTQMSMSSNSSNRIRNNALIIKSVTVGSKRSSEAQDSSSSSSDPNSTDNQSSDCKTSSSSSNSNNSTSIARTRSGNSNDSVRVSDVNMSSQIISNLLGEKIDEPLKRRRTENRNIVQIENVSNSENITDHHRQKIISNKSSSSSRSTSNRENDDLNDFENCSYLDGNVEESQYAAAAAAAGNNLSSTGSSSSNSNNNNRNSSETRNGADALVEFMKKREEDAGGDSDSTSDINDAAL